MAKRIAVSFVEKTPHAGHSRSKVGAVYNTSPRLSPTGGKQAIASRGRIRDESQP